LDSANRNAYYLTLLHLFNRFGQILNASAGEFSLSGTISKDLGRWDLTPGVSIDLGREALWAKLMSNADKNIERTRNEERKRLFAPQKKRKDNKKQTHSH
jgi:hypothetical protein